MQQHQQSYHQNHQTGSDSSSDLILQCHSQMCFSSGCGAPSGQHIAAAQVCCWLSFWIRVRVSVRRCYRFSGLYAFHLPKAAGSDGTTASVVKCRVTRSLGATLNAASDTSLHCPRRTKAHQIHRCPFGPTGQKTFADGRFTFNP